MPRSAVRPRHVALLVLGVLAVSTSAPLIRLADAPPLAVAFYRNAFAAAALLPFAFLRHRDELAGLGARRWGALGLAGAFLAVHFAAWIPSVSLTTVAASTVLVTSQAVWAAVGARVILGERVRRAAVAGIVVALVGAVLISGADFVLSPRAFAGDMLALLGAVTAAGYLLTGRRLRQRLSLAAYAGVVYGVCAVLLLAAALVAGTPLSGFEPTVWLLFVLMAAGPQILGHTVFNYLLRDLDATVVAVAIMGEPVGASLLALALFGEVPPWSAVIGGVVVLVGIYMAVTAQARRPADAPVE
ncbi:MAG TPA: DMT family transporter [Actinomycetota bacterium]|nr:DMT family transporter [Actinomycetota bacterium]